METTPDAIAQLRKADRAARTPRAARDPAIERLDQAILSLGALPARPRFHAEARARAGLGRHHFPEHPARRLDPSPYGVLAALAGSGMPGPASIAIRLGLSSSTVSRHLSRLEARGLVERSTHRGDRRWSNHRLTPAGREAFETIRDARHEALAATVASWTPDDVTQLVTTVARLADAIRVHNIATYRHDLDRRRRSAHERPPDVQEEERRRARERYARKKEAETRREAAREEALRRRRLATIPDSGWEIW